jgi:nitrate reductase molybdenum cofactor assembly chaperone
MSPEVAFADALAALFAYPGDEYPERLERCRSAAVSADSAGRLAEFGAGVQGLELAELQELYIQVFDMNPDSTLDIGWHLFGEEYARGEFLVKMRQEMKRYGVRESTELPDHITHVLPVVARMEPGDRARYEESFLRPALEKLGKCEVLSGSPFRPLIQTIATAFVPQGSAIQ